jgi:DNA-binding MarR family transcriptional regulator
MENTEAFRNLTMLLLRSKQRLGLLAAEHEITGVQATLLLILEPRKPQKMSYFADMFECDASNMTGLTDRLEQVNLIRREHDPADRRIRLIQLTDEGLALRKKILSELANSDAIGLGILSNRDREDLFKILAKLS